MGSRTKNWNKKPGDPSFENWYNCRERERMRKQHAAKKRRQASARIRLGLDK